MDRHRQPQKRHLETVEENDLSCNSPTRQPDGCRRRAATPAAQLYQAEDGGQIQLPGRENTNYMALFGDGTYEFEEGKLPHISTFFDEPLHQGVSAKVSDCGVKPETVISGFFLLNDHSHMFCCNWRGSGVLSFTC
ncbi:hypothetical protein PAMP_007188 [Pampus punctatissimus]